MELPFWTMHRRFLMLALLQGLINLKVGTFGNAPTLSLLGLGQVSNAMMPHHQNSCCGAS
jgi:hypothetical protein